MFAARSVVFSKKDQRVQQQSHSVLVLKVQNLSYGAELHTMASEKWDEVSRRLKQDGRQELHQILTCKKTMTKAKGNKQPCL